MSVRCARGMLNTALLIAIGLAVACSNLMGTMALSMAADATGAWSDMVMVSRAGHSADNGRVAADSAGNIYVVWDESAAQAARGQNIAHDAIFIRTLGVDGSWSEPVDILTASGASGLVVFSLHTDIYGDLVLLWGGDGRIKLSVAAPRAALSAAGWLTTDVTSESSLYADLEVDNAGRYHVVYTSQNLRVQYVASPDGQSWTQPVIVGDVIGPNRAVSYADLALDASGRLYVTWSENDGLNNWVLSAVCVTFSDDGGRTWREPTTLVSRNGHGQGSIAVDGQGVARVVWNRSVGSLDGRYHSWSSDGGLSWATPQQIFKPLDGISGQPNFSVDSAQRLYLITMGNTLGPALSTWDGSSFSTLQPFSGDVRWSEKGLGTMLHGHLLATTWRGSYDMQVWFRMLDTGAPAVSPVVRDRPASAIAVRRTPTLPPQSAAQRTPGAVAYDERWPVTVIPAVGQPLVAGVAPVLVLIAGIVAFAAWRRRR